MKTPIYLLVTIALTSCCWGNRKCNQDDNSASFRIINKSNGSNMVFGSSKVYNKNLIAFYSLNGNDTIFHHYGTGPNPNPGQDSLLYVDFDSRKFETVYLRLNNVDTDTLKLNYPVTDASPCCENFTTVRPLSLNNNFLEESTDGTTSLKK